MGSAEPTRRARPADDRAWDHRLGGRPRAVDPPGQDRDRDLPPQDDPVRLPHDGARRGRHPQGRPLSAALPGRAVLPRRPLTRAFGDPRVPAVADSGQGRLRDQGRARLPASRQLRSARVREPDRLAVRRPRGCRRDMDLRPDRVAGGAALQALRRDPAGRRRRGPDVRHPVRQCPAADRVDARARRQRPDDRSAGARRRAARAGRAARRPPLRRAADRRGAARRPGRGPRQRQRRAATVDRQAPTRTTPAAAGGSMPRSGRSGSRGWSRSPRC